MQILTERVNGQAEKNDPQDQPHPIKHMPAPSPYKKTYQYTIKTKETVILKHFLLKQEHVNIKTQFVLCFLDISVDITDTFKMSYCRTAASYNKSATHITPLIVSTHMMAEILYEF